MGVDSQKRAEARKIYRVLTKTYPHVTCELDFKNPLQLLIATVLSAQCTDKRVNAVTPPLFKKYKNVKAFAGAQVEDIEDLIYTTGFYRAKARHIKGLATKIVKQYGGEVPAELEKLVTLPGVGRKTANVLRSVVFDLPGLAVDTHVGRLSRRLGLTTEEDPVKVEKVLNGFIDPPEWGRFGLRLILHGRRVCDAKKPKCGICELEDICPATLMPSKSKAK